MSAVHRQRLESMYQDTASLSMREFRECLRMALASDSCRCNDPGREMTLLVYYLSGAVQQARQGKEEDLRHKRRLKRLRAKSVEQRRKGGGSVDAVS